MGALALAMEVGFRGTSRYYDNREPYRISI